MNTTNSATGTVRHRTIDSTSAKVCDDESIGCVCFWSVPLVPRKKRAVRLRTTTTDVVVPVGFEVEKTETAAHACAELRRGKSEMVCEMGTLDSTYACRSVIILRQQHFESRVAFCVAQ